MSINQEIKPITAFRDKTLKIGGCDLIDLAKKYGTPLYLIDEESLRKICREYKNTFNNYKNIHMTYASKALCNTAISKILSEEGFGFDTVSEGEIYTVYNSGADMSTVTFNGNNKGVNEIISALKFGVGRFSVDNFYEAEILNKEAEKKNKTVDVLIRITPGIECHTHDYIKTGQTDSKFGFDLSQLDEIIKLIVNQYKNINIKGLHAHIGSQIFELQSYADEIDILIKELTRLNQKFGLNMNELNIGGGLGVKYASEDNPPSVNEFGKVVLNAVLTASIKYDIEPPILYIEPGRSIISTAGVTLYTIGSMKQVPNGRKYITVDGGMADNPRPAMYNAKYEAEIVNNTDGRQNETVTVAGKFCESGDILIENIELPSPKTGDILCVYNTGAYNYSMASNYNRVQKPAMVLVNNSQSDIIVNRETLKDLIRADVIPDRLRR